MSPDCGDNETWRKKWVSSSQQHYLGRNAMRLWLSTAWRHHESHARMSGLLIQSFRSLDPGENEV
jgi:hypothetical protein